MHTLVESEGPIETSLVRHGGRGVTVDRKASLMVNQLKKFQVNIAGISETKWFGAAVYEVEGFMILHSGRPIPESTPMVRNEVVGIVLDPIMATSWRESGEVWEAVNSRIVSARRKLPAITPQDGNRYTCMHVTIVSVYAPTFRLPDKLKEFFAELHHTLDAIDKEDVLLLVSDFNARVGSSTEGVVPHWEGVRGHHGIGRENEAGKELLSFCALNKLAIMNTFFEKRSIYKYTWQHPGSKKWHCIDYVLMKKRQKWLCFDVEVLRSVDCWTDHKLLRAKLRLRVPPKQKGGELRKRYAVARLKDATVRESTVTQCLTQSRHNGRVSMWNEKVEHFT